MLNVRCSMFDVRCSMFDVPRASRRIIQLSHRAFSGTRPPRNEHPTRLPLPDNLAVLAARLSEIAASQIGRTSAAAFQGHHCACSLARKNPPRGRRQRLFSHAHLGASQQQTARRSNPHQARLESLTSPDSSGNTRFPILHDAHSSNR